jgi:hypothetical protein
MYQRPPRAFLSIILYLHGKIRRLAAVPKIEFDYVLFPFGVKRFA